ncbi:MAG: hypothetical protein QM611_02240 [Microbacterium sp.]|uniref:hypothetical protein n=1 Tax=Microbacterium sp. TaxID=51671 RepID=UPI0039E6ABC8
MRGKVGLVIGLGIGYVLGTRAGRQRYEQIKEQAQKVWELDPVQKQVGRAKDFATSSAMALPGALWTGAVKVVKAASGEGSAGQKLDTAVKAGKDSSDDVKKAAKETLNDVVQAVDDKLD